MKRAIALLSVLFTLVVFLAACGGSQEVPEDTAPSPVEPMSVVAVTPSETTLATDTPTPQSTDTPVPPTETPTPAPVSLDDIDLEPLLIWPNDLPSGISGAQVSEILPARLGYLPDTDAQIFQQLELQGQTQGGVAVLLYSSPSRLEASYRLLEGGLGDPEYRPSMKITRGEIVGVGEHAVGSMMSGNVMGTRLDMSDLLFVRCNALISIWMPTNQLRDVEGYGRRLDERLLPYVCTDKTGNGKEFTPGSSGSALADPVYALMTLEYVQSIQAPLDDIFELVDAASENPMLAFDGSWTGEMSLAGVRLWSNSDSVARLAPSERFKEFHGKLLEAVGLLGSYGEVVAKGVIAGDPTAMMENIQDLWDGKAKFEALMGQMDDVSEAASE